MDTVVHSDPIWAGRCGRRRPSGLPGVLRANDPPRNTGLKTLRLRRDSIGMRSEPLFASHPGLVSLAVPGFFSQGGLVDKTDSCDCLCRCAALQL